VTNQVALVAAAIFEVRDDDSDLRTWTEVDSEERERYECDARAALAALSAAEPMYRFAGRATGSDPEGYYFRNWEKAQAVSVVARTKDEAWEKAIAMLGTHPRFGRKGFGDRRDTAGWAVIWDRIDEEATP
jgi:hypothetical protein